MEQTFSSAYIALEYELLFSDAQVKLFIIL